MPSSPSLTQAQSKSILWQRLNAWPNASSHLTAYGGLRPFASAGELKRQTPKVTVTAERIPRGPQAVLRNYFRAKDENRPHMLEHVFHADAELVVVNHAAAISFPARTLGLEA